jgi:hypothetical protein
MADLPKNGGELFIVGNSDAAWKGLNYSRHWAEIPSAFGTATGFIEIGALVALNGGWQKPDKIRILLGDQRSGRTRRAMPEAHRPRTGIVLNDSIGNL